MKITVCKRFRFEAAHYLPHYEGKCKKLHGHTWWLEVEVEGPVDAWEGFVVDFAKLKECVRGACLEVLDHSCLNDLPYVNAFVSNPTCENLLAWIWQQIERLLPGYVRPDRKLVRLRLWETPDSFAELRAGDA